MKAIIIPYKEDNTYSVVVTYGFEKELFNIADGYIKIKNAQELADRFNKNLSQHVQSELSAKIAEIEKTFTDRKVRPLDPVWVKNEILKILKGQ